MHCSLKAYATSVRNFNIRCKTTYNRIIQFSTPKEGRRVGLVVDTNSVVDLTSIDKDITHVWHLFHKGLGVGRTISGMIEKYSKEHKLSDAKKVDYLALLSAQQGDNQGWLLPPLDHPDEAHCIITGTGLTHLGSSSARDQMHKSEEKNKTDSQKMFEMGVKGGKPASGRGIQPEWFYKGNGNILRGHNANLTIPEFADDGGEEPEIFGCYIIGKDKIPYRIGFVQGNEWSDHKMEKQNYLWLAPSKLRECSIGPELVILENFDHLEGHCKIHRGKELLYDSGTLLTGEKNMSHHLENIEDHHFKYPQFRIPGDVHLHTYGTSKISFPNRPSFETGDTIEVSFKGMGPSLVNYVLKENSKPPVKVVYQHNSTY